MPYGSAAERRVATKWPYEPQKIHRWERGPSSATVMILSPNVVVTEVIGSFVSDAIDTVKPPIQQLMARSGAAHVFWDAEGLESHDGPVVAEVNGSPGLQGPYRQYGDAFGAQLVEYIERFARGEG